MLSRYISESIEKILTHAKNKQSVSKSVWYSCAKPETNQVLEEEKKRKKKKKTE